MLRYFAIATVLVLGIFVIWGTWWEMRPRADLNVKSVAGPPIPRRAPPELVGTRQDRPFVAEVAWGLSALPDCFNQESLTQGHWSYVRAHLPSGISPVPPGTTARYGDCTLGFDGREIVVRRDKDVITIPEVELFSGKGRLYVLHRSTHNSELRVYTTSKP